MFFGGIDDLMFTLVPIVVLCGFVLVIGMMVAAGAAALREKRKNDASPVLTVEACVVSKRGDVHISHHHHGDNLAMSHTSSSTTYYVTFEVESGDRMEFHLSGSEYGQLVEGDRGRLTFQGTRYLGFERHR